MSAEPQRKREPLVDSFGRVAKDLRVSLIDKCNLRCTYCMPAEGLAWLPREEILTDDEIVRLVGLFTQMGVTMVRLTGGEPLIRPGLPGIVERIKSLPDAPGVAMTTNGIGLARLAGPLAAAGLDRINVSLDTVDRQRFADLTRRDRLDDVLAGLEAAVDVGLSPVKVNSVAMRGLNDDPVPLLRWCLERGLHLRFIEQMPLDADHRWSRPQMVSRQELLTALQVHYRLTPRAGRGSAPAEVFDVDDGPGTVGVIASVTDSFCGSCDRVRLTADGQVRNFLFARTEAPLRDALRSGASDDALAELIRAEMWSKKPGHGIDSPGFVQPDRPMSAIGG